MTLFNAVVDSPELQERARDAEALLKKGKPEKVAFGGGIEGFIQRVNDSGRAVLWDTLTGEPSEFNPSGIHEGLRRRRPDGSYVFTATRPNIPVVKGELPCLMHKDSPERPFFDRRGSAVCRKLLRTEDDVDHHMKARHRREWEALKTSRDRVKEDEERQMRRAMISQFSPKAEAPKVEAKKPDPVQAPQVEIKAFSGNCPQCDALVEGKTNAGLKAALRWHIRGKHGQAVEPPTQA